MSDVTAIEGSGDSLDAADLGAEFDGQAVDFANIAIDLGKRAEAPLGRTVGALAFFQNGRPPDRKPLSSQDTPGSAGSAKRK